jgi:DNA topoisomerase-2
LGTSTAIEAKEYFKQLKDNRIHYSFDSSIDSSVIERTFEKDKTDERKEWITNYINKPLEVDYKQKTIPINYFIDRELVQFSVYDGIRSIPNIMDGFKPSQRKVLFGSLKKKLFIKSDGSGQIKVAQLSGYVSEVSGYHHGEVSLQGTIVKMAQDFVGSGNINLFVPEGNFGSRLLGGEDAASARYIFTYLKSVVKTIFNETDNQLLKYLDSEGDPIEPEYYMPIIPMILVNGSVGLGTGWSTNIPCFNAFEIIDNLKRLINGQETVEMNPYYRGFKGIIEKLDFNSWKTSGTIEQINDYTVRVTELPVGMWKQDFKEYLDTLIDSSKVKSVNIKGDTNEINYLITFSEPIEDDLVKLLKLEKKISGNNMVAFNEHHKIVRYDSVEDIMWSFYKVRLAFYNTRRTYLIDEITRKLKVNSEKLRFIKLVINDQLIVFKRKKVEIINDLQSNGFENTSELSTMSIDKFTTEEIEKLEQLIVVLNNELIILNSKSAKDIWIEDLNELEKQL